MFGQEKYSKVNQETTAHCTKAREPAFMAISKDPASLPSHSYQGLTIEHWDSHWAQRNTRLPFLCFMQSSLAKFWILYNFMTWTGLPCIDLPWGVTPLLDSSWLPGLCPHWLLPCYPRAVRIASWNLWTIPSNSRDLSHSKEEVDNWILPSPAKWQFQMVSIFTVFKSIYHMPWYKCLELLIIKGKSSATFIKAGGTLEIWFINFGLEQLLHIYG